MIAYLKGTVKYILNDGCVLEVNGVGYKVTLNQRLRAESDINLFVITACPSMGGLFY